MGVAVGGIVPEPMSIFPELDLFHRRLFAFRIIQAPTFTLPSALCSKIYMSFLYCMWEVDHATALDDGQHSRRTRHTVSRMRRNVGGGRSGRRALGRGSDPTWLAVRILALGQVAAHVADGRVLRGDAVADAACTRSVVGDHSACCHPSSALYPSRCWGWGDGQRLASLDQWKDGSRDESGADCRPSAAPSVTTRPIRGGIEFARLDAPGQTDSDACVYEVMVGCGSERVCW